MAIVEGGNRYVCLSCRFIPFGWKFAREICRKCFGASWQKS
ncbi:hypothetical protein B4135_1530 [Caldibacillus debilis]|uniref:Uncharacterized protein n=1 Tax=Caldibacillus debilis TaxID=301148 RepID=A0A150MBI0_9BACI|nr:hypothetical protein B4135_1530 [Caldibacillus debilis]